MDQEKEIKLRDLRNALLDCCSACASNKEELNMLHSMLVTADEMLNDVRRKLGYMAVYPIVNGSAQESLFEGTKEQCVIYTKLLVGSMPELKDNIIILQL